MSSIKQSAHFTSCDRSSCGKTSQTQGKVRRVITGFQLIELWADANGIMPALIQTGANWINAHG